MNNNGFGVERRKKKSYTIVHKEESQGDYSCAIIPLKEEIWFFILFCVILPPLQSKTPYVNFVEVKSSESTDLLDLFVLTSLWIVLLAWCFRSMLNIWFIEEFIVFIIIKNMRRESMRNSACSLCLDSWHENKLILASLAKKLKKLSFEVDLSPN